MAELEERDAAFLWHPATHFQDLERLPPLAIERAEGPWLIEPGGRKILDAISSWWTCLHGHGHPRLVEAIAAQVARLDHVMFAGFTHAPAVDLAEALLLEAGPEYGRVFYADCGSAAIEVAMKLSYQYRLQSGEPERRGFATLKNSYHGETLGALSVSGSDAYRELFAPLLLNVDSLPAPSNLSHSHRDLSTDLGASAPETEALCAHLERHAAELTALVIEPLIQCAGRMVMPGVGFYRRVVETAQRLGIHVIADEIAVAFGRTGRLLASSWAGVAPDLLCLSKGLSGGVMPLSAVLIRSGIEDAFRGDPSRSFLHSHTFTGNPIACAAGLASLGVFEEERVFEERLPALVERLDALRNDVVARVGDRIRCHRQLGAVVALEVEPERIPEGNRLSLALREAALQRGVLLRPLHDTIYWMPPYCVGESELELLGDATVAAIRSL